MDCKHEWVEGLMWYVPVVVCAWKVCGVVVHDHTYT